MFELIDIELSISNHDLKIIIPIVFGLLAFIIFWFIHKSNKVKKVFLNKYGDDKGAVRFQLFTRYLGGIVLGMFPLIIFIIVFPETSLVQIGLGLNGKLLPRTILWITIISLIAIPLVYYNAKKPKTLAKYPEIRTRRWNGSLIINNLLAWAVYLLGYEILFRGLLLFTLVQEIGLWPAIAVNIAMYSGTHISKGLTETLGAIPLAIIFCLISVFSGSIWAAFIIHVVIAWTNSLTALKFNPDMEIVDRPISF